MTFQAVSAGLISILQGLGLNECLAATNFKAAAGQEYGNTFILNCESGEAGEANDQQAAQLYDNQVWSVKVAFEKNSESDNEQLKALHRKRDAILVALDDPASWTSFASILRYSSWNITVEPSYYVLEIRLKVIDVLTY